MSHRRFHVKSRYGCLQCKKSRTKCDETRPRCGRCQRVGSECSLADPNSGLILIPANGVKTQRDIGSKARLVGSSSSSSSSSIESATPFTACTTPFPGSKPAIVELNFTDLERERLQLMNHYTLHASKSITEVTVPEDRDQSIWNQWVTELAFENDFLLHGLLSLSALHLALAGVYPRKNTVSAIRHHLHGTTLFRPYLSKVPVENYDAVFAFLCVVALYSFGIQRVSEPDRDTIADIHQVLTLVRGSSGMVKADLQAMQRSRWSALMLPIDCLPTDNLPEEMETMLSTLLKRASPANHAFVYTSAIRTLRLALALAIIYPRAQLSISLFPIMTPADFWVLVSIRDPLALAILANYAVILYGLRENIWLKGWGTQTVHAVREALPAEWQDCIAWAVTETQGI